MGGVLQENTSHKGEVHRRLRNWDDNSWDPALTREPLTQFLELFEQLARQIGFQRLEKLFLAL